MPNRLPLRGTPPALRRPSSAVRSLSSAVRLLSSVLCLLVLNGCGRRQTPADAAIATQTLLMGNLAEPRDLDPHIVTAYTDMNILAALFEGLTVLDERTGQALPGVASRWDISPDGLIYTFHLRPDAKWSNGEPVTSEDFAWSFRRILSPAYASEYAYMLWPLKNAEAFSTGKLKDFSAVGVATPDAVTLRLTLEQPTPYLLAIAAHNSWYPVHRATIEKFGRMEQQGTAWTRAGNLVGNGPFVLREWTPNARIVVDKSPHYWDAAQVRLNHIHFFPTESADVEERNFRAGQTHITYDVPVSKILSYRAQTPSPLRNDPFLGHFYINYNVTKAPLDNPLVRRALSLAIDREAISRSVLDGVWPAAPSYTPPDCGGYTARTKVAHDPAAARRLLAEAGYPEGRGLPTISLQILNDVRQPKIAEAIQAMWKRELGVNSSIEASEQKIWIQNQASLAHMVGILGWIGDFPDPVTFLSLAMTGNGNNYTGWSNREYDALMTKAASTADAQARFELFQQAEALLLHEAPVAPLVDRTRTYLIHPAVKNWDPALLGIHLYKKVYLAP